MRPALNDYWSIDPLPVPPNVPRDSMAYWRWWSAVTLAARKERD